MTMKVVFLGSGDFAFPLARKIGEIHEIVAIIITKPKPKGRGLKTGLPKIGEWAKIQDINVISPEDPNSKDFIEQVKALRPDIFILAAYGHILKKDFLLAAPKGGINIHPSLLPLYRGAAPIQRCLMNGDDKTGVTIFFMDEKIDHGEIIYQEEVPIGVDDDYGSLCARLAEKAQSVIGDVIESVMDNTCQRRKQQDSIKSLAPKIKKEELYIDWQKPARIIHNLVRALAPKPGARAHFRDQEVRILKTSVESKTVQPGEIVRINKNMAVGTGQGALIIERLKPSNRAEMSGLDFINGVHLRQGETFI